MGDKKVTNRQGEWQKRHPGDKRLPRQNHLHCVWYFEVETNG